MNLRWTTGKLALCSYGHYLVLIKLRGTRGCSFFGGKIGYSYDPRYDHTYLIISGFPSLCPSLATFGGSGVQNRTQIRPSRPRAGSRQGCPAPIRAFVYFLTWSFLGVLLLQHTEFISVTCGNTVFPMSELSMLR
ncbi:hypothetical protein BDR03DRAFT_624699 [Suillus americanus]|nr:hypothetical protein BDR03DRAFT_624699 [Suillus americanus]